MLFRSTGAACLAAALVVGLDARAEVKLPPILNSHMVLQREMAVPIWGTAAPNEKVTVKFRDQEKTTTADKDGKWSVKLDALKAGGPDKLTANGVTLEGVMVGEVWLGSGQSNMQGSVGGYAKGDPLLAKLAASKYPNLRLFVGNKWVESDEKTCQGFSAILFAFGQKLQADLDVPVGLMVGAVGGTPSGPWMTEEMFKDDPACQALVKKLEAKFDVAEAKKKYEVALAKWEKDAEEAKKAGKNPPAKPQLVQGPGRGNFGGLYKAHILPKKPFAIRGVLWDQGESGTAVSQIDQYTLMGALIRGWRKDWDQGEFPFIFVQKPSGGGCAWDPKDEVTNKGEPFAKLPPQVPNDGLSREIHIKIKDHPNTLMATSTDLGPGIHPSNKAGYGYRAARVALGKVYGKKLEYYGPVYASHSVEAGKVRVKFTHLGEGLAFKHGDKLQGFAVAGKDKVFHWAEATIDGDTVVLSCPNVTEPVAVRYAWASKAPWANLFNKDGLPAIPFRTDEW